MGLTQGRQDGHLKLVLNPEVYPYFSERKTSLEKSAQRPVEIQSDGTLSLDDYKIIIE